MSEDKFFVKVFMNEDTGQTDIVVDKLEQAYAIEIDRRYYNKSVLDCFVDFFIVLIFVLIANAYDGNVGLSVMSYLFGKTILNLYLYQNKTKIAKAEQKNIRLEVEKIIKN